MSGGDDWDRRVISDKVPVFVCKYAVYHASVSLSGQIMTTMIVPVTIN